MIEKKDIFSILLGLASLVLTIIALFKQDMEKFMFYIGGIAGLVIAVIMLYIDQFISKMDNTVKRITELEREVGFNEQIYQIKAEIERLKRDKKGKNTDIVDFIKIILLLIIFYLILKALNVV